MMGAPNLNRRFALEELQRTPDGAGGFSEAWTPLGTLWAELKAGTGRDRADDLIATGTVEYRITVHAAPWGAPSRPRPGQRLREGDRIFAVLAVAEAGTDGRFLTCHAREEVVS